MRAILFFLVVVSLGMISVDNSYGQTTKQINDIYVQITIQDSNGNLVAYLEPKKIVVTDIDVLDKFIDTAPDLFHKSTMTIAGNNYDLIKATYVAVQHSSATIVSRNSIDYINGNSTVSLVFVDHDGYPVVPGDKVTIYWTILRPSS